MLARLQQPGLPSGDAMHAGRGRHSNPHIGGVLTDAAKQVLHRQQLPFSVKAGNAGMLHISAEDMAVWSAKRGQQTSKVMHVCVLFEAHLFRSQSMQSLACYL
jgi:hypothetical protein